MAYPETTFGLLQNIRDLLGSAGAAFDGVLVAGSNVIGAVTQNGVWTFIQSGFSFLNITTSTTTTVKSGAGVIHSVTINALGTVASSVVIYDSLSGSGTKIGTINSLALSGTFFFDVAFVTGLTVVTTGAPDITVSYR